MTIKQLIALACAAAPVTSLVAPRSSPVKTALKAWGPVRRGVPGIFVDSSLDTSHLDA